ncbi:glycoside hydrolase family 15 protein [Ammoniphilus sp. CFH 90114]|uniref:glycoside hydrolase family 15 protein n=1 Tax=Ammoniphilus sp. CFH 90114 TaxID=2493665 RepID=UPI00100EBEA2|nr:glycoside hydrolase family 15 protein [Ammoniphilus sp. CFH 90114]RXT15027.1 glycoside hydrolase family 15 protein [Ammoniphilus sp. CFH 90114]
MPRPLVIGNGKMLINFDSSLNMRDLYYPYVGQLNQIGGYFSRIGVWTPGHFSWCQEEGWEIQLSYLPETLVTHVVAENKRMGVRLTIEDAVHQRETIYLKKVKVMNLSNQAREIRLFFNHDYSINETEVGDTALFDPILRTVYHYKRNVYIMINGKTKDQGIYEYSTGVKRFNHAEGTWRDAEDGQLSGNPIAQGSVDSTVSFQLYVSGNQEESLWYWISIGKTLSETKKLNQYVLDSHPDSLMERVKVYWQRWVNKSNRSFGNLPEEVVQMYKKSLLVVRTQTDQHGAIVAANDSDILQYNRDHYSYMWPRDGALVAYAMTKAGYEGMVSPFFEFCSRALTDEGYLQHKYNPDGSVGSSWHPYVNNGKFQLPIQEDETALVLFALWEHYSQHKQIEFSQSLYAELIRPAAKFLTQYVDERVNLPKASYDLWEERRGIFTFTACSVYGGLMAAAKFASLFGDDRRCNRYKETAERIREGIENYLYDKQIGRFIRGIYLDADGSITKDLTLESSLYALFAFQVFDPTDERVVRTMEAVEKGLTVHSKVGGICRYQNDYYFQKSQDIANIPGNPWIICTLWMAEWRIAKAVTLEDLEQPLETFRWVVSNALESGVLPEQLDPYTGNPLSVAPLTWSHSTFVLAVLKYLDKYEELKRD